LVAAELHSNRQKLCIAGGPFAVTADYFDHKQRRMTQMGHGLKLFSGEKARRPIVYRE